MVDWTTDAGGLNPDVVPFDINTKFPISPMSENCFWLRLVENHPAETQWEFEHLIYEPVPRIDTLKITEKKDLNLDHLQDELGHAHRQARAIKALKRSMIHWASIAKTKLGATLRTTRVREVRL